MFRSVLSLSVLLSRLLRPRSIQLVPMAADLARARLGALNCPRLCAQASCALTGVNAGSSFFSTPRTRRQDAERAFQEGQIDALGLQSRYASALALTLHADAASWRGRVRKPSRRLGQKERSGLLLEREREYGGRRRGSGARTTLSPGNRADPGLVSVRGLDWLGPVQRREGSVHVYQTHRHAARRTERRSPARGPLPHTSADAAGRRGAKGREQADLLRLHEGGQAEGRRSDLATRRGIGGRLRAQAHGRWGEGDRRGRKPGA